MIDVRDVTSKAVFGNCDFGSSRVEAHPNRRLSLLGNQISPDD